MPARERPSPLRRYLLESREIERSVALVVPLLLAYEVTLLWLMLPLRNSAELAFDRFVGLLPSQGLQLLRLATLALLLLVTLRWLAKERSGQMRAPWILAEAFGHAIVLGPLVALLVGRIGLSASSRIAPYSFPTWTPFLLSVGAGLWEEIVFRLALLGGLALLLRRALGLREIPAHVLAIVLSALVFALYHHVGVSGEPLAPERFAFRAFAGTILGLLFWLRGFAVVVYMHVFYDVLCDLRALHA